MTAANSQETNAADMGTILKKICEAYPSLDRMGLDGNSPTDATNELCSPQGIEEFQTACLWFEKAEKTTSIPRHKTSYAYKHDIERWIESSTGKHQYVSNGACIAAAIHFDFAIEKASAPNCWIGISETAIKQVAL